MRWNHGAGARAGAFAAGAVALLATLQFYSWAQTTGQEVVDVRISFQSPAGQGSGTVSWRTTAELDVIGFNVITLSAQGAREQQNTALINCDQCVTGAGAAYTFIIPKHKSGRNIYVEMLRLNGTISTFGPATRQ